MNYVHSTIDYRQVGWVGDDIMKLNLHLYADANYGTNGGKSTSGVQLNMEGPSTCFPMSGLSVSQGAVAHSTPEAEIIAAATALRKVGIPAMVIWEKLKTSFGPLSNTGLALVASAVGLPLPKGAPAKAKAKSATAKHAQAIRARKEG